MLNKKPNEFCQVQVIYEKKLKLLKCVQIDLSQKINIGLQKAY